MTELIHKKKIGIKPIFFFLPMRIHKVWPATALNGRFRFSLSSYSAQRLVYFGPLATISQQRGPPVHTPLNGRVRFSLSSYSAQRLVYVGPLATISQHRGPPVHTALNGRFRFSYHQTIVIRARIVIRPTNRPVNRNNVGASCPLWLICMK